MKNKGKDLHYILNILGEECTIDGQTVSPPIHQTSNFSFITVDAIRNAFKDEFSARLYTRGNNPTVALLRKKLAALADAEDALVLSSGAAAMAAAVMAHVKTGDHIVCVKKPYSWTERLLSTYLNRFGITNTFVDGTSVAAFEKATITQTKLYVLESPNTFTFELQDIRSIAHLAKQCGITTIIDNSYCTSIGQSCIELGIDIEIHSASKYYGGHSDLIAGVILSNKTTIEKIFNTEFLNYGAVISPNDAWLMIRSLRTLPIRLQQIADSTNAVIGYIKNHPKVKKLYYPFDDSHPQHSLAQEQMNWCGGLFSVELNTDNLQAIELFCDSLKRFKIAVSWGGHESLVMPACAFSARENFSHTYLPANLVRFYIGLDDAKFLIEDLQQAFEKIE